MTEVTFTKVAGLIPMDKLREIVNGPKVIRIVEIRPDGLYDIIDNRGLVDRLNHPINGTGIRHYISDTRYIVTKACAERLGAQQ